MDDLGGQPTGELVHSKLHAFAISLGGGTTQIQQNIIAERVLGLPRSIGEIYGLLFISQSALSLDDLVLRLHISKGSASQGLRMLKSLGAVREVDSGTDRRTYFEPAIELKRLAGGFIREQIRPHLDSGRHKIKRLGDLANAETDPKRRKFLLERTGRLDHWIRNGGRLLPMIQRILGQ
jgi:DNA-binding transcriptional regulator GbsR (MarR family)